MIVFAKETKDCTNVLLEIIKVQREGEELCVNSGELWICVGIHTRARVSVRAVSRGMQMSAGCIRCITQHETPRGFFALRERNTRREFERAEKSELARIAREYTLHKRKFAKKFTHALGLSAHCETLESSPIVNIAHNSRRLSWNFACSPLDLVAVVDRNSSRFSIRGCALADVIAFLFQGCTVHYCHL